MKSWLTTITAINPMTGELVDWPGPLIPANSKEEAVKFCLENGYGYCKVMNEFEEEIKWPKSGKTISLN